MSLLRVCIADAVMPRGVATTTNHLGKEMISNMNATKTRWSRLCAAAMLAALIAQSLGCGGGGNSGAVARRIVLVVTSIHPEAVSVAPGEQVSFDASFTTNEPVPTTSTEAHWSVEEDGIGGRITNDGVYTAGDRPGVYHLVAESVVHPGVTATATVTVAGAANTPTTIAR